MKHELTKPVIGILGGIGAGKSTVAAMFAECGCAVIDADRIGHDVLKDDDVIDMLRTRWGDAIIAPDGSVNRKALGEIVFADPRQLDELNRITHPRIRRVMEQLIRDWRNDDRVEAIVVDAAVLLEAKWDDLCTHLVWVDSPDDRRFERVNSCRGWNRESWASREKSQICLDSKRARCEYKLVNRSSVSCLREEVRKLYYQIVHPADRSD